MCSNEVITFYLVSQPQLIITTAMFVLFEIQSLEKMYAVNSLGGCWEQAHSEISFTWSNWDLSCAPLTYIQRTTDWMLNMVFKAKPKLNQAPIYNSRQVWHPVITSVNALQLRLHRLDVRPPPAPPSCITPSDTWQRRLRRAHVSFKLEYSRCTSHVFE